MAQTKSETPEEISDLHKLHKRVLRIQNSRVGPLIYRASVFLINVLAYKYLRVKVGGRENLIRDGGFILAPVHRSNLDAPLINVIPRKRYVKSLAKINMFKSKTSAFFSAGLGCIPLDRDTADLKSLKLGRELLEKGEALLIFPEGLRGTGTKVGKIFEGCAYLSIKSGAPIVPIGISGTEKSMPPKAKLPRRGYVNIEVGEAILPPKSYTRSARNELTSRVRSEMQRLMDLANSKSRP